MIRLLCIFMFLSIGTQLKHCDAERIFSETSYNSSVSRVFVNPYASVNNPCADIRNGQFVCLDCETLAFCLQESGNWVTIEYEKCRTDKSMYCNDEVNGCILQHQCTLPSYGMMFDCQNPGQYPDPYNCKYYHICSDSNEDKRVVCPSGWAYSTATKECSLRTDSQECKEAQYTCEKPGAMHAWQGDNNIFYVCHVKASGDDYVLYPVLYRCPDKSVFNGEKCVGNSNYPTPPPSTKIAADDDCNADRLASHPTNCRNYYYCANSKWTEKQCPSGTYYDAKKAQCVYGNC